MVSSAAAKSNKPPKKRKVVIRRRNSGNLSRTAAVKKATLSAAKKSVKKDTLATPPKLPPRNVTKPSEEADLSTPVNTGVDAPANIDEMEAKASGILELMATDKSFAPVVTPEEKSKTDESEHFAVTDNTHVNPAVTTSEEDIKMNEAEDLQLLKEDVLDWAEPPNEVSTPSSKKTESAVEFEKLFDEIGCDEKAYGDIYRSLTAAPDFSHEIE